MRHMLIAAGAVGLAVVLGSGPVLADQNFRQAAPAATSTAAPSTYQGYNPSWHYEWQYHYGQYNQWTPGWVAVPNNAK